MSNWAHQYLGTAEHGPPCSPHATCHTPTSTLPSLHHGVLLTLARLHGRLPLHPLHPGHNIAVS